MNAPLNGIDVAALGKFAETVSSDVSNARAKFGVKTRWAGQTRTVTPVDSYELFGVSRSRDFKIDADEPVELFGRNTAPNPQELLMAALNACMSVGLVAMAAAKGIAIRSLEIETKGELDLRGFLGMDGVNPGYDEVQYTVRIDADATPEQVNEIHQIVVNTSPNFANFARAIRMVPSVELVTR